MAVSDLLSEPGRDPARVFVEFDLEPADFADPDAYHLVNSEAAWIRAR